MKSVSIAQASTFVLKIALLCIGLVVFVFCAMLFPEIWHVLFRELPEFSHLLYPALIGFFATAIPFFYALYQAFRLLQLIDRSNAFSAQSVQALCHIKYCAIAMGILYAAAMPLVVAFAEYDDAPGVIIVGMAIVCAPFIVATFAAVLQKLIQSALDMKTENDLTI